MNIYIFAIAGLIVGAILGWIAPFHIPISYANYTSVAVLAALDAVFGGSRAALERIFVVLAVILVYVGDLIGINLYYVALIGFGLRVFINVGAIRKIIMTKRF